jgi:hypothetical protein
MEYYCQYCKFYTDHPNKLARHSQTKRHMIEVAKYDKSQNTVVAKPIIQNILYSCIYCDKEFSTRQSRSRHMKHYCRNRPLSDKERDKLDMLEKRMVYLESQMSKIVMNDNNNI